jgi:hypothetical protein
MNKSILPHALERNTLQVLFPITDMMLVIDSCNMLVAQKKGKELLIRLRREDWK